MRRKLVWLGLGVLLAGGVIWNATQSSGTNHALAVLPTAVVTATAVAPAAPVAGTATAYPPPPGPTPTPAAPPILLLNAGRVMRRSAISASGFGFLPHEKLRLAWQGPDGRWTTMASGQADKDGNFGGLTFTVPDAWPTGTQHLQVTGLTSGRVVTGTFVVVPSSPGALPNTYAGKPLTPVSFHGGGFRPHEVVVVYFDSLDSTPLGRFEANAAGIVNVTNLLVPPSAPGAHAFLLVGQTSGAPVRIPFSVLAFTPWLGLSDYTPQPEHPVAVVGHDFAPGERVAIFLGTVKSPPVAQGNADRLGVVKLDPAFVVPWNQQGKLTIIAVGALSQIEVSATLDVRPYTPTFSLSTYAGPPGTAISAQGQGFAHHEQVTLRLGEAAGAGSAPPALTLRTDAQGKFQTGPVLRIPPRAVAGKLKVTAEGAHSQVPASVTFAVLPLAPWITSVPAAGHASTVVTLDGGGFEPGEKIDAVVGLTGAPRGTTIQADLHGGFKNAGMLAIPAGATGRVTLQATGQASGVTATATYVVIGS